MKRTITALAIVAMLGVTHAAAEERVTDEAREAVRALRDQSFLVSRCEKAFASFWTAFRTEGNDGLVYSHSIFGGRTYYGFGNVGAEPMLAEATAICQEQTGVAGDRIIAVLTERAEKKAARQAHIERTNRLISGW